MSHFNNSLSKDIERKQGCPDCGNSFLEGPRGGMSVMVRCCACGHEFTITPWRGRIVAAERVERNKPEYYTKPFVWPQNMPAN